MDSDGFDKWIKWWHDETEKHNPGPKLLIMDNCGGHSVNADIHGVRIITLPPRTTARHQPLDLGLIGNSKIRYRSLLLQSVIRVMEARFRKEIECSSDSERGMCGIREGQLPHVGDAMNLFNEAWSLTRRLTVIKCCVKSICLPENLLIEARELLESLLPSELSIDLTNAGRIQVFPENVVPSETSAGIFNDMQIIVSSENSTWNAPAQEIIDEARDIVEISEFFATINSPASFDADPSRDELAETFLQSMFDENCYPSALGDEAGSQ